MKTIKPSQCWPKCHSVCALPAAGRSPAWCSVLERGGESVRQSQLFQLGFYGAFGRTTHRYTRSLQALAISVSASPAHAETATYSCQSVNLPSELPLCSKTFHTSGVCHRQW